MFSFFFLNNIKYNDVAIITPYSEMAVFFPLKPNNYEVSLSHLIDDAVFGIFTISIMGQVISHNIW